MVKIEELILRNLLMNEGYVRKTLPFLKSEYFDENTEREVFNAVNDFFLKYNNIPTKESLTIEIDSNKYLSEQEFDKTTQLIGKLYATDNKTDDQWLLDNTEKFCQEKAIYNGIRESISILDDKSGKKSKGSIPVILSDALSVSFDSHIGHDFFGDVEERFDFYHRKEEKVPSDLDYFNKITNNGIAKKSLTIILAGINVGKSLAMCHMAAANLLDGKDVLYITLEMAEERIAERIDANTLNVSLNDVPLLPKAQFEKKINLLKGRTSGKLIIKEYPTATAGVGHFRFLLNELKMKKNFVPDIIYVDYINICISMRLKGNNYDSYSYIKSIAEELRGLAVEHNVPIISATQLNRPGFSSSDPDMTDTAESFGLPATADFMVALVTTEELEELNQLMVKQLKNRYADKGVYKRFMIGIDTSKMRLYNLSEAETEGKSVDWAKMKDEPVMDKTTFGRRLKEDEEDEGSKKKKFKELKI